MGDLVAISDVAGELVHVNPALHAMLHRTESHGNQPASDAGVAASVTTPFGSGGFSLGRTARTGTPERDVPVVLRGAGGEEHHILWHVDPILGLDGVVRGAIAVGRDVTADRAQARVQEDRLAIAVHDLRSPVTSILGYLELAGRIIATAVGRRGTAPVAESEVILSDDAAMLPRLTRYVERAETAARELRRAMQMHLDALAASGGHLVGELEASAVDLGPLARAAVEHTRSQTTRHTVTLHVPVEPLMVKGDGDRVHQLLDNLLSNAVKYAPDGGPIIVRLDAAPVVSSLPVAGADGSEPRWAILQVEDTGLGIPAADVPFVFDRYWRASGSTRLVPGTGLGLYVCRAVVAAHGGHIWVERTMTAGPEEGGVIGGHDDWHGTVITVALPLARDDTIVAGNEDGAAERLVLDAEDDR